MTQDKIYVLRLKPGEDLKESIEKLVRDENLSAAWIHTCVGSLTDYAIRFANKVEIANGKGHFEILSLAGTLSVTGCHLHISISDHTGKTIGGHLMKGCRIYTTAEIVLQSSGGFEFTRKNDGSTPWAELQVRQK